VNAADRRPSSGATRASATSAGPVLRTPTLAPVRVAYTLEQCWHPVPGGTAVATLALARALLAHTDIELVGVAGRHRRPPRPEFRPPIPVRRLALARPWLYEAWNRTGHPLVERATGPVDVCHSTTAIPAPTRAAHVVTVHDVAFVHTPERFTAHGARVMRAGLERCRLADLVLCPSRTTADDLAALRFDPGRVRVIPWGVAPRPIGADDIARVRARYELPERFVLFVGTLEPRKNLRRLAEAVSALDTTLALVVAGAPGWGDAAPFGGHVQFLGFVSDADLAALYGAATVFAYPSLQEGFGLPVAEAMSYGAPVITSAHGATAEVAGGAAVLVDPLDPAAIGAGLRRALADADTLRDRGRARAAELTWERAAADTVAAYHDARELAQGRA
jgi:glycosyltransferase involved in cell wall biosynthesis